MYKGELISLLVTLLWTVTAMAAEVASKRLSPLGLNVVRMLMSLAFLAILMWVVCGQPWPQDADGETWLWLSLSGFVGYVLGDYCLFNSYLLMGSRFGQLFMTLAPAAAALFGFILLGETMSPLAIVGMLITMFGIGLSVLSKGSEHHTLSLKLPLKGILFGIGAGLGQGIGLVLSKVGMTHYETLIQSPEALDIMPFSSTFIRAITGLVGFLLTMFLTGKTHQILSVTRDRRGMTFALIATLTGPFLGVSLSLMATLYTSTGIAQTIMAMTPIFILLPSWYFFHQRVTLREVIGAIISVVGVALFFL
ncbi:MAG: DMT family transporter [Bacteroidaceae bacterium]|nr:DMT family transporter [Bacteroidaceae bacterium]